MSSLGSVNSPLEDFHKILKVAVDFIEPLGEFYRDTKRERTGCAVALGYTCEHGYGVLEPVALGKLSPEQAEKYIRFAELQAWAVLKEQEFQECTVSFVAQNQDLKSSREGKQFASPGAVLFPDIRRLISTSGWEAPENVVHDLAIAHTVGWVNKDGILRVIEAHPNDHRPDDFGNIQERIHAGLERLSIL